MFSLKVKLNKIVTRACTEICLGAEIFLPPPPVKVLRGGGGGKGKKKNKGGGGGKNFSYKFKK